MGLSKLILPLVAVAGLSFCGISAASSKMLTQPQDRCNFKHNSDVCVLNNSGEDAYVSIKQFGVEDEELFSEPDLMFDYFSDDNYNPIEVTIYDALKNIIFQDWIPNHGSILEILGGFKSNKLTVKMR